jgi:hypothetical protein
VTPSVVTTPATRVSSNPRSTAVLPTPPTVTPNTRIVSPGSSNPRPDTTTPTGQRRVAADPRRLCDGEGIYCACAGRPSTCESSRQQCISKCNNTTNARPGVSATTRTTINPTATSCNPTACTPEESRASWTGSVCLACVNLTANNCQYKATRQVNNSLCGKADEEIVPTIVPSPNPQVSCSNNAKSLECVNKPVGTPCPDSGNRIGESCLPYNGSDAIENDCYCQATASQSPPAPVPVVNQSQPVALSNSPITCRSNLEGCNLPGQIPGDRCSRSLGTEVRQGQCIGLGNSSRGLITCMCYLDPIPAQPVSSQNKCDIGSIGDCENKNITQDCTTSENSEGRCIVYVEGTNSCVCSARP